MESEPRSLVRSLTHSKCLARIYSSYCYLRDYIFLLHNNNNRSCTQKCYSYICKPQLHKPTSCDFDPARTSPWEIDRRSHRSGENWNRGSWERQRPPLYQQLESYQKSHLEVGLVLNQCSEENRSWRQRRLEQNRGSWEQYARSEHQPLL